MNANHHERKPSSPSTVGGTSLFLETAKPTVVGTGLIALDIVVGPDRDAIPRYWAGGTCGNVLAILAYLGWNAYPASCLGNDVAADLVLEDLKRCGVKVRFTRRDGARHTPIVVEKLRQGADGIPRHRFIWTCPACGAWLPGYRAVLVPQAARVAASVPKPTVFFFDRVSRGALTLAQASAMHGALVVFEPNGSTDSPQYQEALQLSHIIKYSQERVEPLRQLTKCQGRKLEIETLGSEGLRYRFLEGPGKPPAWKALGPYPVTNLKDTAGAGDWCTAGLLHMLGREGALTLSKMPVRDVEAALKTGQAMACLKCRYEGPRSIMYSMKRRHFEGAVKKILEGGPLPAFSEEDVDTPQLRRLLKRVCPKCPSREPGQTKPVQRLLT